MAVSQFLWRNNEKIFVVHRWDGTPKSDWYPWLKNELKKSGFKVEIPSMPKTSEPEITSWVAYLKKVVGKLDSETIFVGHSIGCQTIMRYLEKDNYSGKVGKIVFVAGWFKLGNLEGEDVTKIAEPWLKTPVNFENLKKKISSLTVFLSDNEPYGFVNENAKIFRDKLNANVCFLKNKGHFTEDDNITFLPELLKEIYGSD